MIRFAAFTAITLASLAPAAAGTQHSIDYTYYAVAGRTPAELYRSILARGPTVGGERAIAATAAQGVQNFGVAQEGKTCRVTEHRLNFTFTVKLPRATALSAMRPKDRALWQQFSVFLKAHELQHTKLWLGCAADLDRAVTMVRASTCKTAARKVEALWRDMKARCDRLQTSFDREQRRELLDQPFMQRVMRGD